MIEPIVYKKLMDMGFDMDKDRALFLRAEAVGNQPRILDKAPARLTFKRSEETPIFGCKQEFILNYNDLIGASTGEVFTLDFGSAKRLIDKEVFYVLQTLIRSSISGIKERAEAAFTFFRLISTAPGDTITVQRCSETVVNAQVTGYYEKELQAAITFCLSGGNPATLYWVSICEFSGLYEDVHKEGLPVIDALCKDEKDVNKFVKDYYAKFRKDTNFKNKTYSKNVSKAILAMVYYLAIKNGEVQEQNGDN